MKSNTIILIIATLVVAAGGYWYFSGAKEEMPLTTVTSKNESQAQFQTLVSQLRPISFNTNIFSQPAFMSLVDLKTEVTPETVGRSDPFAPISGVNVKNE
jgi:flagellar basal body-associated protein FliL